MLFKKLKIAQYFDIPISKDRAESYRINKV